MYNEQNRAHTEEGENGAQIDFNNSQNVMAMSVWGHISGLVRQVCV